jgi:hypothetical protein
VKNFLLYVFTQPPLYSGMETKQIRRLIEARALLTLHPSSDQARAHYNGMMDTLVRQGHCVYRLGAIAREHSVRWIASGATAGIRRAKLAASQRVMQREVARMLAESAYMSWR